MPSLFSRSRTFSTPQKKPSLLSIEDGLDEFGRVASGLSNRGTGSSTPSKKDKKKEREQGKRSGTHPPSGADSEPGADLPFPDGSFLPFNPEPPKTHDDTPALSKEHDYGYLSYERHVVLGLEQVERLVDVIAEELEARGGLTTPFIFSNTALDISSSAIKRLIHSFIETCIPKSQQAARVAESKWREEARYVGPHELGMCLRWGLARAIRSVGGQDVRGLVSWDHYIEFRDSEAAFNYPPAHFQSFLPDLPPPLQFIIVRLLSLLARLVANSASSGHTPPTLSPLFGPLFFGLGPATLAFHHAYIHYLRSVNAMEHILLSFVRWQDTPRSSTASAASLGVPIRLKEWIKGYPSTLPFLENKKAKPQPRKGARTVRVMSVRRNVRMYSPDLVKTASTWAQRNANTSISNGFASSKEWDKIAPATLKLPPRYSENYKKKMNMPSNFHPDAAPGASFSPPGLSSAPTASISSFSSSNSDYFGLGTSTQDDRFRSLTDLKWGEFESMGFSGLGDGNDKKLQFDLTESARQERSTKRQTLSWNDFSSAGFSRTDGPLSATLQFSTPVVHSVSSWPTQSVEINRKLKKSQKSLPAFGWDTEPVIGSEEVIEECFVDVFCDLIYGGGWMDLERGETLDRDCNWALVEYKSLLPSRTTASGGSDPRTATNLILFEEFVPLEYRQQLAIPSSNRRRLPSLFSPSSKSKQWKQAATLNGRPYVVGHVPRSPSFRELEFEGLLHGGNGTKVITLGSKRDGPRVQSIISAAPTELPIPPPPTRPAPTISPPLFIPEPDLPPPPPKSDDMMPESTGSAPHSASVSSHRKSRFRLPGGIPVPSPGGNRKSGMVPAEYSTVEFETRMASYSDDEYSADNNEPEAVKQKRRESQVDAWVDILVGSQSRRLGDQDVDLAERRQPRVRKSDPDMVSKEVAQVLAAVKERSPSPPSVMDRVDRDYGVDNHVYDLDVDEIETVPRSSDVRSTEEETSESEAHIAYEAQTNEGDIDEVIAPILNTRETARQQRRLGYFDLHPERRPTVQKHEEDPRDRLAMDDSDDEADDERVYGAPDPRRPLPIPPVAPQPAYGPPSERVVPDIKITTNALVPLAAQNGDGQDVIPTDAKSNTSKTAALIEMYRERERGAAAAPLNVTPIPVAPLTPSRLPVRSASLPKEPQVPALPVTPSSKPSPKISPPETDTITLPAAPADDAGRSSPARYVHGAPLHNVLEEEEEEV